MQKALKYMVTIVAGAVLSAASGTIFAQAAPEASGMAAESDSLARALASYWGNASMLKSYTPEQRAAFIEGVESVLNRTSAEGEAYERGVTFGASVSTGLEQMSQFGLKADREVFAKAMKEVLNGGNVGFSPESADAYINSLVPTDPVSDFARFTPESQEAFLAAAAAEDGAVTTESGLVFKVITEGEGEYPTDADRVEMNYTGRLSDGTVIDSTTTPVNFDLVNLVKGFSEGLKMMRPGGTYRIVIPASIGYGERGIEGAIPPGAALDFTVDLIGVDRGAAAK